MNHVYLQPVCAESLIVTLGYSVVGWGEWAGVDSVGVLWVTGRSGDVP